MTDTPTTQSSAPPHTTQERTGWAGWAVFAGVMLVLVGAFQAIDGLVALFKDEIYVVRPSGEMLMLYANHAMEMTVKNQPAGV